MNYIFNDQQKAATAVTAGKNAETARRLHLDPLHCDSAEHVLAEQNCILPMENLIIRGEGGSNVWDLTSRDFLLDEAVPDTVNPSLWCHARNGRFAGIFEVVKGAIYQARGFELANLTIIRGRTGWIVQDAMTSTETARAAIDAFERALGEPVREKIRAVIISHSHFDHFGGIFGVVTEEQVGSPQDGKIPIYAPAGFDVESVRENVFAGTAMRRRSMHQFGGGMEIGPRGSISTQSVRRGSSGYLAPTDVITEDGVRVIDGLTIEFQLVPDTEAVADMNSYFADYRALWMADNAPNTLHNLYPIRGAQIRDGEAWARYSLEAAERFADRSDVLFQGHGWARYNTAEHPDEIREYLTGTAAIYKYQHDQTLLYANKGLTAKEIAGKLDDIPEGLYGNWNVRPYYGTPQINARAVYTKYLGFYNGIPTDLDALTEKEDAALFVEFAGGEENVLAGAVKAFETGDYRKASNAAGRILLVNPDNVRARQLTADAYEQLGYAAESGIWRNAYLQEAAELRGGTHVKTQKGYERRDALDFYMPADLLLSYAGILLDYDRLQGENFSFTLTITDGNGTRDDHDPLQYYVRIYAGILLPVRSENPQSERYVRMPRAAFFAWFDGKLDTVKDQVETNIYEKLLLLQDAFADLSVDAE